MLSFPYCKTCSFSSLINLKKMYISIDFGHHVLGSSFIASKIFINIWFSNLTTLGVPDEYQVIPEMPRVR